VANDEYAVARDGEPMAPWSLIRRNGGEVAA